MSEPISPPGSKRQRLNAAGPKRCSPLENQLRIHSWNVNGIGPFVEVQPTITSFFEAEKTNNARQNVTKASLRDFLRRHDWPTLLCLQEVKINPDDSAIIKAVEQAVRKQRNEDHDAFDYEAHFCLPSDKYNARGWGRKIYGVCTIVRKDFKDDFVEKIRPVDFDTEGRFLVVETKSSQLLPRLGIINVYAVNGTEHPYKDPATGKVIGTRHDRKLQVHKLLQAECRAMEAAGFQVILAGDMNIARSPRDGFPNLRTFPKQHCLNRADFEARFFSEATSGTRIEDRLPFQASSRADSGGLGMIDTFRYLHPSQNSYTYYTRSRPFGESCDRVDMIIVSHALKDNLREAGMHETASERGPSDHVPLFARLVFDERHDGGAVSPTEEPVIIDLNT